MKLRRSIVAGGLLAGAAASAGFLTGILTRSSEKIGESDSIEQDRALIVQLLSLTLRDANGTPIALSQWQGKTLVINFWATWCPPCREEMPGFSRQASSFADKNVQFVGIAIDSADKVREFAAENPVTYPLLIADAQAIALGKNLGNSMSALPFTVITNPDGSIRERRLGAVREPELAKILGR